MGTDNTLNIFFNRRFSRLLDTDRSCSNDLMPWMSVGTVYI